MLYQHDNVELALALPRPSKTCMRLHAPILAVLALSVLAVLAPAAHATPHRAPAKPVHTAAPKSTGRSKPQEKKAETKVKPGKNAHAKGVAAKAPARGKGRHAEPAKPTLREVSHKRNEPAAKTSASRSPAHLAKLEKPAIRPEPKPEPIEEAAPLGPEPHVTHNRKVHLEADPAPLATANAPAKPSGLPSGVSHPDTDDELSPRKANAASTDGAPMASVVFLPPAPPPAMDEVSATHEPVPELYNKRGRLIMPPPMKGSHEILVRQNVNADRDGLERIQDDEDLMRMREARTLVPLPVSASLQVDERLPANRRYARPWAAKFLADMAREHYARFHTPLQVNSAVRTVAFQVKLIRTNGNAAPAEGDTASPHLTGQALDIAKKGLSLTEIAWMRGYLLPLVQQGKVDVEEEFQQSCFHISVYRKYMPQVAPRRIVATHRGSVESLAAAMQ
jgi:hypothetical protein